VLSSVIVSDNLSCCAVTYTHLCS